MSKKPIKSLDPISAHKFLNKNSDALLVDVRCEIEYEYIGHPVDAINIVWKKYKSQEGKYDIEYVFKHWILITMNLAFKKDGWDINGWFYKITNKNFELPLDD